MVSLSNHMRYIKNEYVWDSETGSLLESGYGEIMTDFAVVNHFLRALASNDLQTAHSFAVHAVMDVVVAESAGLGSFLESHLMPMPFRHAASLAEQIGYRSQASDNLTAIVAMEPTEDWSWDLDYRAIERVMMVELSNEQPAKISHMTLYDPKEMPRELDVELEHHHRPMTSFNRLGIDRYAQVHSWAEANDRVKRVVSAQGTSDWVHVSAILRSPTVQWVETQYRAYLNFDSRAEAERRFAQVLNPNVLPFLVVLQSSQEGALDENVVRFVLTLGEGNRWEGVFRAEGIAQETHAGSTLYRRAFWVEFPQAGPAVLDWEGFDEATLHVIRQDRLSRVDLTWDFAPFLVW